MDTKWKLVALVVVAAVAYAFREPIADWWHSLKPSPAAEETAAPTPDRTTPRVAEMDAASQMSRDSSRGSGASTGAGAAASRASNSVSGAERRELPE
jgi:hypothetical protein